MTIRDEGTEVELKERKKQVLTRPAASITQSIAQAIVLKNKNLYFLTERDGDAPLEDAHGYGLYYDDHRYLSGYSLRLAGLEPKVLVANAVAGHTGVFELTNPPISDGAGEGVTVDNLGITRTRVLAADDQTVTETIDIKNYGREEARLPVTLSFRDDFRDIFAIRGLLKEQPGEKLEPRWLDHVLVFAYEGADDLLRQLEIHFAPAPDRVEPTTAEFNITLASRATAQIQVRMVLRELTEPAAAVETKYPSSPASPGMLPAAGGRSRTEELTIESDSLVLNGLLNRSRRDLTALENKIGKQRYYAAGVPWFVALFGRDSIITALQTLSLGPAMAEETLRLLARYQAREVDEWRDAQPGKILHELRFGELANIDAIPHTPYYGSVDATPLFLILVARHAAWTGGLDLFHELRDSIELGLTWIDDYGDLDGDGYVEYDSVMNDGLINQGWKDSGNAILLPDCSLPQPPIALVEVQGYVYQAKIELADLYEQAGDTGRAQQLRREAQELRRQFNRDFWSEELGCYALALHGDNEPLLLVTSNSGHALWSGIADEDKAQRTARRLMAGDMFSGWGIRTLSTASRCYNPTGYHLGTVGPHDNSIIAAGLRRYGQDEAARRVVQATVEAAIDFDDYQLPELWSGFGREEYGVPVRYPVACHPQAWAAGATPFLLTTLLGLQPQAFQGQLRVVHPLLPDFADQITIRNLVVGQGRADLGFARTEGDRCAVEVLHVTGNLEVVIQDQ